jgi:hypothetical protein
VYAVSAAIALAVGVRVWRGRRNAQVVKAYLKVAEQVEYNCITVEPFFRYLYHLRGVISTRPKDEVLHFDSSPEKLLESYVKQEMRNADPDYQLLDERLSWRLKSSPSIEINLPATPWMNEFVRRLGHSKTGPGSVAAVVARLDEAIDCLRDLPRNIQIVPGISADGKVGVHLQERSKDQTRREYVQGYLVLAALWSLHSALLLTHGRTWEDVLANYERLILAFGPPVAGYALMRIAFWVRPVSQRPKQSQESLKSFLFHPLGDQHPAGEEMRAGVRAPAGR